jgi:acetyl esterase/lipase
MRLSLPLLLAACMLCAAFGQSRAEYLEELEGAAYMEEGIVYAKIGDRELHLNLYRPSKGEGPFPAVVFVHGGGWRAGHRGHFSRQAMYLSSRGYVCACIEYRLSGEARFPAQIEDVKCAIRWMRSEGSKHFGADPGRIAVSGGSAGGHLALLAGTSGGAAELEGAGGWQDQSSAVQCVVAFNPAVAFPDGMASDAVSAFLGGTRAEVPEQYRLATPATWLDEHDPPMLLLHGNADKTVPYSLSAEFVAKLKALGIQSELYTAEGKGHSWFSFPPDFVPTTRALEAFLEKYLK